MGERSELNIGQLARERHGPDAVFVGFATHHGTVTAASGWGGPADRKRVRPVLSTCYEGMFHGTQPARFLLTPVGNDGVTNTLWYLRLERAIGVVYLPESERLSHYFHARLASQFNAILNVDETQAVEPLERTAGWEAGEAPETFPFGV